MEMDNITLKDIVKQKDYKKAYEYLEIHKIRELNSKLEHASLKDIVKQKNYQQAIYYLKMMHDFTYDKNKIWDYKKNKLDNLGQLINKFDKTFVYTNEKMAKYLIKRCNFKENDIVLEPCMGNGAFYDHLPFYVNKDWCELSKGRDFFNYNSKVEYVIGNPPFVPRKLFWRFHLKAMSISTKGIFWLINMLTMNAFTPRRLNQMNKKGWYIQSQHIVNDKRWYGRYVWIHFSRKKNNYYTFKLKPF